MPLPVVGLQATIEGLAGFESGTKVIVSAYTEINNKSKGVEDSSGAVAAGFTAVSTGVTAAIGVLSAVVGVLGSVGEKLLSTASSAYESVASYESLTKSLTALAAQQIVAGGGAADMKEAMALAVPQAQELAKWIEKVALLSPLNESQVQAAFQMAMNYRFTTEEAKRLTQAEIDFAAATNVGGESMERITRALGQMKGKPQVAAEELNQLRDAGFPVSAVLDKMGYSLTDVENKLVGSADFIEAATQEMEVFSGFAAENATSLTGLKTSFEDMMSIGLRDFFQATFEGLQPYLAKFLDWFTSMLPVITEWGGILRDVVMIELSGLINILSSAGVSFGSVTEAIKTATDYVRAFVDALSGVTLMDLAASGQAQLDKLDDQFAKTTASIEKQIANLPEQLGKEMADIAGRYMPKIAELAEKFAEKRQEIMDRIAEEEQSNQDKLVDIADKAAERRQAVEDKLAKAREDAARKSAELAEALEENLAEKRQNLAESIASINEKAAEKTKQIEQDIKDKQEAYEQDKADTAEKYADKKTRSRG